MLTQLAPPFATSPWYQASLSCTLLRLAQKYQETLPHDICASLNEASARVFIQESYINDLQAANPEAPVSSDPAFLYNGYASSLGNLFKVLTAPGFEGTSRGQVCHCMYMHLQNILNVVHSKRNDVSGLFRDPNMGRALADLVGFLSAF